MKRFKNFSSIFVTKYLRQIICITNDQFSCWKSVDFPQHIRDLEKMGKHGRPHAMPPISPEPLSVMIINIFHIFIIIIKSIVREGTAGYSISCQSQHNSIQVQQVFSPSYRGFQSENLFHCLIVFTENLFLQNFFIAYFKKGKGFWSCQCWRKMMKLLDVHQHFQVLKRIWIVELQSISSQLSYNTKLYSPWTFSGMDYLLQLFPGPSQEPLVSLLQASLPTTPNSVPLGLLVAWITC